MGSSTGGRVADSSSASNGDTAAGGDKSLVRKLCPPWPLSNLIRYLRRLSDAFGARYVFSVILTYGVNQSIGERWIYYARSYYLLDEVGLSSQYYGQLLGFSSIPWQLKSLFGLLSDTVPIRGLHRAPYMLFAGVVGVAATVALTALPPGAIGVELLACVFLLINVNFAMPDVMIDATVAERSKVRPEFTAELQAPDAPRPATTSVPPGRKARGRRSS